MDLFCNGTGSAVVNLDNHGTIAPLGNQTLIACGPDVSKVEAVAEEKFFDDGDCPDPIAVNVWNGKEKKVVLFTLPFNDGNKYASTCIYNGLLGGGGSGGSAG